MINKYKNMSKPAKASLWFVVSNVLVKGMSFITLPIFSRLLTTSEYGIVSVYQSWVATVSIVTTLTIWGGVFNVGMIKHGDHRKELISSFQGLAVSITGFFMILSIPIINYLQSVFSMSPLLIICMYIEIMFQVPHNIWATEKRYDFEYKKIVIISMVCAVINPLLGYIAVVNTNAYKAEARIISSLLIQVVIGGVLFVHNQRAGKKFFHKEFWKFGFLFNVVLIPHYLSTQILNQSDRLMINKMCGSDDAGIYSVAYNFAMLLSLVTSAINSSLTPYIYQTLKSGKTKKLSKQTTSVTLLVAILTIGIICFVPDLFLFLLPTAYYPALKVIPPVSTGAFFYFMHSMFGTVEFYYEKNWYVTCASVIGALVNIVLNFIFINIFGFIAAAYTTLFCYICFCVCHYIFMRKVLKDNSADINIYNTKLLLCISIGVLMMTFIMLVLYDHMVIRWGVIVSIIISCFVCRKYFWESIKDLVKKE
ncbi:MAG: oligosaccharide flippase family protein [Acetatifactor sp.]|nr:oligosaccharide flippase family protein [Acetatifactor sp.]